MSTPIFEIAEKYVKRRTATDPCGSFSLGLTDELERLTDFSPEAIAERADDDASTLLALREQLPTSEADRIALDYIDAGLSAGLSQHQHGDDLAPLDGSWGPLHSAIEGLARLSAEADKRDRVLELLAEVPRMLSGLAAALEVSRDRGMPGTAPQAIATAAYLRQLAPDGNGGPLASVTALPGERAATGVARARAAFGDLALLVESQHLPVVESVETVGTDAFIRCVAVYFGGAIDLHAAYEWAWSELHRIEDERSEVCNAIEPGADRVRAVQVLQASRDDAIESPDACLAWAQEYLDAVTDQLDGVHFDIPASVRPIEVVASPGGTYYTPPSVDLTRPGRMWLAMSARQQFRPLSALSTIHHEGVPGHHLQNGQVRVQAGALSDYQQAYYLNFHGEGWALYAERLMLELGYLERPEAQLSLLQAEFFRALRVVLDIGLNLGLRIPMAERSHAGERWTPALARAVLAGNGLSAGSADAEVTRYLCHPGQAITYALGARAWNKSRETCERAAGGDFDRRLFHNTALALGPLTVEQLEREVVSAMSPVGNGGSD